MNLEFVVPMVMALISFTVWTAAMIAMYLMYTIARDRFHNWMPTVFAATTLGHVVWLIRYSRKKPVLDLAALTAETMNCRIDYDYLLSQAVQADGEILIKIPNAKNKDPKTAIRLASAGAYE